MNFAKRFAPRTDFHHHGETNLNTEPVNSPVTISGSQAAILHSALTLAVESTRDSLKLKSSERFAASIKGQLAAYEAEKARLAASFPELAA